MTDSQFVKCPKCGMNSNSPYHSEYICNSNYNLKEIDQCPQCFCTVEITNGCKTKCKNCGFHVRDCSDLA